jgi:hypothetical protein
MTPQEILHSILLDAKARIKDGELRDDYGGLSIGICSFCHYHKNRTKLSHFLLLELMDEHRELKQWGEFIADEYDFTDPKRLALLDWLIERTKP